MHCVQEALHFRYILFFPINPFLPSPATDIYILKNANLPTLVRIFLVTTLHPSFSTPEQVTSHAIHTLPSAGTSPSFCSPYDLQDGQPAQLAFLLDTRDSLPICLPPIPQHLVTSPISYSSPLMFPMCSYVDLCMRTYQIILYHPPDQLILDFRQSGSQLDKNS